jgi:putative transposase
MPQSLNKVILHMVFSTKDRMPLIDAGIRPRLHAYMATVFREIDPTQCQAYRVGGVADHVHIAGTLPRTVTVSKLFEIVKKESSIWIKKQGGAYEKFYWQAGYGCFSVAPSQLDQLIHYIDNQEDHHKTVTFQDEFRTFLSKYNIEYDERYVWD